MGVSHNNWKADRAQHFTIVYVIANKGHLRKWNFSAPAYFSEGAEFVFHPLHKIQ